MGDTTGSDDDRHYLQRLKDKIVVVVDHLLNQIRIDRYVNAADLKALRNRARYMKVSSNADVVKREINYFIDKLDELKQVANEINSTDHVDISQENRDAIASQINDSVSSDKIFNESVSVNDANDTYDDVCSIGQRDDFTIKDETDQSELMPCDKDDGEKNDTFYDWNALRDKNEALSSTSFDQVDGKRADRPCDSSLNDRVVTTDEVNQSPEASCAKIDVSELNNTSVSKSYISKRITEQLRESGQKHLLSRDEIVKPFCELKNELPSLNPQSRMVMKTPVPQFSKARGRTDTPYKVYEMDWRNVESNSNVAICRQYNITDRNWIVVKLFADYYLVTIQTKLHTQEAHEYLNKYNKETGDLLQWLFLPDAGKMCKIKETGLVAVLQIRGQKSCIVVVFTSQNELGVLYRFMVPELYSDICCLRKLPNMNFNKKKYPCFEFAAVFGAQGKGMPNEEIDRLHPEVVKCRTHRNNVQYSFGSRKSKIVRINGICSIDAMGINRIVLSVNYGIACIDLCGNKVWYMPTDSRVTDICCYNNNIFACLPDNGQILKMYTWGRTPFIQDENIIKGERITPSQVSACNQEILIREFIQREYRSEVLIRVIET